MRFQPIETQRLNIRHFKPEDWEAVHTYTGDAAVMTWVEEGQMSELQTKHFVAANIGDEAIAFPVFLKSEDRLIGHLSFHPWFGHLTYEIGWVFHPAYHGKGYATEAAKALVRYCFGDLRGHRLIATCQPENTASYRVMEKIGMRREAHFRKGLHRGSDVWWDEYFYAILDEEWIPDKEDR